MLVEGTQKLSIVMLVDYHDGGGLSCCRIVMLVEGTQKLSNWDLLQHDFKITQLEGRKVADNCAFAHCQAVTQSFYILVCHTNMRFNCVFRFNQNGQ